MGDLAARVCVPLSFALSCKEEAKLTRADDCQRTKFNFAWPFAQFFDLRSQFFGNFALCFL